MAGKFRRAGRPTPEQLEALYEARRRRDRAEPGAGRQGTEPGAMKTYKVKGDRIVHGKKKGDLVDLWETGATRALVQAGHLTEVTEPQDRSVESADDVKEADNG